MVYVSGPRRVAILALSLAACGGGGGDAADAGGPDGGPGEPFVEVPIGAPATATIGGAGGVLVSTDGRLTLDVPAGALAADTVIEIQQIEWPRGVGWRLAPEGLQFALPVTVATTFTEAEVGVPTREIVDGVETYTLPVPGFAHVPAEPWTGELVPPRITPAWREADGELDYAAELTHFSLFGVTFGGEEATIARVAVPQGEDFDLVAVSPRAFGPFEEHPIACKNQQTGKYHMQIWTVPARYGIPRMTVDPPGNIALVGAVQPFETDTHLGHQQTLRCLSPGIYTVSVALETTLEVQPEYQSPDCFAPVIGVIREVTVECNAPCTATDPVDLSLSPDGDPSLDLRCATTGVSLEGRPWVSSGFEGDWTPPAFYSWFARVTLYSTTGTIGSFTHEVHDGVETFLYSGAVTAANSVHIVDPKGHTVLFDPALLPQIDWTRVDSGLKKTVDSPFLTDQIDVIPFDATVRDP